MEFYKYHSLGNDYLVYDIRKNREELDQEKIVRVCSRNFGIGSDGIVAGPYEKDGEHRTRMNVVAEKVTFLSSKSHEKNNVERDDR